jgi:hypothetical protein
MNLSPCLWRLELDHLLEHFILASATRYAVPILVPAGKRGVATVKVFKQRVFATMLAKQKRLPTSHLRPPSPDALRTTARYLFHICYDNDAGPVVLTARGWEPGFSGF